MHVMTEPSKFGDGEEALEIFKLKIQGLYNSKIYFNIINHKFKIDTYNSNSNNSSYSISMDINILTHYFEIELFFVEHTSHSCIIAINKNNVNNYSIMFGEIYLGVKSNDIQNIKIHCNYYKRKPFCTNYMHGKCFITNNRYLDTILDNLFLLIISTVGCINSK